MGSREGEVYREGGRMESREGGGISRGREEGWERKKEGIELNLCNIFRLFFTT